MGRLKELLINANLDLDEITVSKAEARRLLNQFSQEDAERIQRASRQKQFTPQPPQ